MTLLSLHSQVVAGHVGNAAAVLPLQLLGFEVWAVPTVLYSNHPGHGAFTGRITPAGEVAALVDGLAQHGVLDRCDGVLIGYLGDAAQAAVAADAITRVRARNPAALVLCDPILGDQDTGLYVAEGIPRAVASELIPLADVVTPNHFELETLTGARVRSLDEALGAVEKLRAMGPKTVVCSSLRRHGPEPRGGGSKPMAGRMETLVVGPDGAWIVGNDRIADAPHGAGDMLAALFLGHTLRGEPSPEALRLSVSTVWSILVASVAPSVNEVVPVNEVAPVNEMNLVAARANVADPNLSAWIEQVG